MTATAGETPVPYPFNEPDGISLADAYQEALERPGLVRVRMTYGDPAWLATRYADARLVLGDRRFSRAEALRHDEPRQSEGSRDSGILSMDPPGHTRLRTLVAKAFTVHQVEKLRPWVRELAHGLLDELEAQGRSRPTWWSTTRCRFPSRSSAACSAYRRRTARGSGPGATPLSPPAP